MTLEFGPPRDFVQAVLRLPNESHPLYDNDNVIHQLAEFKSFLIFLQAIGVDSSLSLPYRSYDLSFDQLRFMEHISFKRNKCIATYKHSFLDAGNEWSELFETGDDCRGTWEIHEISPDLMTAEHHLFAVMFHKYRPGYGFPPNQFLFKPNEWHIEIAIAKNDEVNYLAENLRQH